MDAWQLPGFNEIRELGQGGFSRVVMAREQRSGAPVAIKYFDAEHFRSEPHLPALFRTEVAAMRRVQDPHVARIFDWVESPAGAAIVMELVDGVSLATLLENHGATTPEAALAVLKGSLLGLSAAHAAGVVHRDYKPANVIVRADGASVLIDFGIAAPSGAPGAPAGTPAYMAPEQWEGAMATPATDVYAATCVFFQCVSGRRPYQGADSTAMRAQHASASIPLDQVPGPLRALVGWGMAKRPDQRPVDLRRFVVELESAAVAAYGPDWERRGVHALAVAAVALAGLFPLAATAAAGLVGGGLTAGGAAGAGGAVGPGVSGAMAPGAGGHSVLSGGTAAKAVIGKGIAAKAAIGVAGAVAAAGAAGLVYVNVNGNDTEPPPPPPHYTLQELRAAFITPTDMGGGYEAKKIDTPSFVVCHDKNATFPGNPKTAAQHLTGKRNAQPPQPDIWEWAAEYPDAESARRAFEQLKGPTSCPASRHVPRRELEGDNYEPAHDATWRRQPGKVSGWTQSRTIERRDYTGSDAEPATILTTRDFLLRGNGLYLIQYASLAEPEDPETVATKPASQWVQRLLSGLT